MDISRVETPVPVLVPEGSPCLEQWELGPTRTRPTKRFHEIFEAQVDAHPQRAAVVTESFVRSYAEVENLANGIAARLLELGVVREEPVAVLTECSADLPAAVLGIWKAGAVYVPLALDQPEERLAFMAGDSGAKILIALDGEVVPRRLAQSVDTILRAEDWSANRERPKVNGSPKDLAYIVYTSGTTGMPKGVLIQHDSLVNAAYMTSEVVGLTPEDRISLVATPGFDASLWELGLGLLFGRAIVPVAHAVRDDPWRLKKYYTSLGVTAAFHTPSYLRVSKEIPFEGLRVLFIGGEAPTHNDARCYAGHLALWNAYGPTETTIVVSAERLSPHPDPDRPLSVGRPLANTRISIRSNNGDRVPPGDVGEVWLGGVGLARGYLNNPELTAQRFVETPEGRFYRSGDLGRWSEDGRLELSGRIDFQVKLHGQRVELTEIDQKLLSLPGVEEAVTVMEASANETKVLRAFVRLRADAVMPAEEEWRGLLGSSLPLYMIPASVDSVVAIPLTSTGKVDRRALLLTPRDRTNGAGKSPPSSEMESRVATLWRDLLGETVSREDNFFALGGNSLLAVTVAHHLSCQLAQPVPARELFAAPTLAAFAQRIEELRRTVPLVHDEEGRVPVKSDFATEGQREFRVAEAAGLDTRTFTIPLMRLVEGGKPSLDRWNAAWSSLVARHEALRTYFDEDAEGRLHRAVVPVLVEMLESVTLPDRLSARAYARERQGEAFVMGVPPLWRAGVVEEEDSGEQLFWLALHHSLGDGRSLGIIVDELGALLCGEELPASTTCSFSESAAREEAYLAAPACAEDARYWRELFLALPEHAFDEGPLEFPRSTTAETGNHRLETCLDAATVRGLKALARRYNSSLHAVMLTVLALEARRRTGHAELVIGTTASVRESAAEEQVIGYYVNMLPLPFHLSRPLVFGTVLRQTQQTLASALQHARYPFARIYQDLRGELPGYRHPTRYPLFDLAVTENPALKAVPVGLRLSPVFARAEENSESIAYERTGASPGQDMVLIHEGMADGGMLLQWHVNAALYTPTTALSWFEALRGWAVWLADDPERAQETLPSLLPSEDALLEGWEQGAKVFRPPLRAHELFERVLDNGGTGQVERPAVIMQAGVTSYGELEEEANAIAHYLLRDRSSESAAQSVVVGVLTGRSAHLPAAVMGIWKAGATYLPLAVDLPAERLAFMASDAGAARLIVLDGLAVPPELTRNLPYVLRPEEMDAEFRNSHGYRPQPANHGCDVAYIIYTSGSTGQPKGTLIGHDSYVNMLLGAGEIIGLTREDRCLMFSSPSFDVSLSDMGLPLAFGAALCPLPHELLSSPNRFRAFLAELDVTMADVTPTYLRLFDGAELPSLRILITGGESPFLEDVTTYARRHQYFNAYGPSENTITSTMGRLSPEEVGRLSSGHPLPNTSVHICDAEGNLVPPGTLGEVWLGGVGLACGYVGRPELTAAAFVETKNGRRYRSGDQGRWLPNGELEILGRIDDQIKLNGIRIELGEIEAVLNGHASVAQAVALLDGDAEKTKSLWAFVRLAPGRQAPTNESWHEYLASWLPAYMIPSAVIAVPEIPLSNSGKVDKVALKMLLDGRTPQGDKSPPRDGMEFEIARVWSELLGHGLSAIHRDDNFFELGGHSLLAIAVAHRLEEALGHPIPARELFAEPTLRGFAHRVGQLITAVVPAEVSSDRATEGQREFWIAERAGRGTSGFNIALTLRACGRVPPDAEWRDAWAAMVARHDALRTGFHQDGEGVLRRSVGMVSSVDLEISNETEMAVALAHIRGHQTEPFVMESPPLWRAGLVHVVGTEQPVFWFVLHHSIGDGVSLGVLVEELSTLLRGGRLLPITCHFDQSAGREESYLAGSTSQIDAAYWQGILNNLGDGSADTPQPFDEWHLDSPRPSVRAVRNTKGVHVFRTRLDASVAVGLREFARRNGASLHALMLTIMAHEVWRRSGRSDFLLGTAASTRDSAGEARVVGYYVNMLPVLCRVHGSEPFEQALQTMQRNLAEGLQHLCYPFALIYREYRKDHALAIDPARYPLFDFAVTENPEILNVTSNGDDEFHFIGLAAHSGKEAGYELHLNGPAQDMVLVHQGQEDGSIELHWYVNAEIYQKETAKGWIGALDGWARFLVSSERLPGSPLPALLQQEERLLAGWEHGPALEHPARSLPAIFEHWARVQPDRPALITDHGSRSYAELDARSNALAHALQAQGVARQEVVGVLTGRSIALPEVVLGIWKAGGCYLPLVSDLPVERMAFIARDAAIKVLVILDGHEMPLLLVKIGCKILRPEELSEAFIANHSSAPQIAGGAVWGLDLAYIIYTSGSTGEPKGVMLHHQGLINFGVGIVAALDVRSSDRALLVASPAFDAWISDVAMAWTVGAALVPIERGEMDDLAGMRDKIERLQVSVATMTPSYLRLFEQAEFPGLCLLLTVGEPPNRSDALHYAERLRYMNGYGPTENTVAASFGQVMAQAQRITAGKPLANTSIHIRNSHGEPLPPGAVGVIWLGGMGLASGYLNRPDLTSASFVETSVGRLYCTGDLGRWTCSGDLEVLGRSDEQVKLRGHRVELGEIEHRLGSHPDVRQAVAVVETRANRTQILWAFVCVHPKANEVSQTEWHDYLSAALPSYMVPSAVLSVPTIPVNIAGKVDRAELLRMVPEVITNPVQSEDGALQRTQPREGTEHQVAEVWAEHLEGQPIAREDNFFNLGGDSLRAIAVVNQLRRTFDCTVNDLYEHPDLTDFAAVCQQRPEHLRTVIQSAARHWQDYRNGLAAYDAEREAILAVARREYEMRSQLDMQSGAGERRDYATVLLTGATGYLGSYLLRELLADQDREVSVLVRGADERIARARLGEVLCHYFGVRHGAELRDNPRLTVQAGDLRRDDLGLSSKAYDRMAKNVQAIFHCAANVKHFGHYWEFDADNVAATGRLLKLAAHRAAAPADFHLVSTLSVCGKAPEKGFRLFTEYDGASEVLDDNYYIRSKQEAEKLVVAARRNLANACIHRVGNLVFAFDGGPLQLNIRENAFFRQLAAFLQLGAVPDDSHLWQCHVDVVARGIVLLAGAANLTNETYHLENVRLDTLAAFVGAAKEVRVCSFGAFLERLQAAVDEPCMNAALTEILENFGLYRGVSPQARARRLEIVSGRTQNLMARLGLFWPNGQAAGQTEMLRQAARHFSQNTQLPVPEQRMRPQRPMPFKSQSKESQSWTPPRL
jgi:amino acid adenylation domain-containing protein/thioester reductase-like protein